MGIDGIKEAPPLDIEPPLDIDGIKEEATLSWEAAPRDLAASSGGSGDPLPFSADAIAPAGAPGLVAADSLGDAKAVQGGAGPKRRDTRRRTKRRGTRRRTKKRGTKRRGTKKRGTKRR